MCDSGRVRARGNRHANKNLAHVVEGPDSIHTPLFEIKAAPPVARLLMASASPSFRVSGEKTIATIGCRLSLLPSCLSRPGRMPTVSGIPAPADPYNIVRTLVVCAAKGPLIPAMYFHDSHSKSPEALVSMVGTDKRRGWAGKSHLGSGLKGAGYGRFNQSPRPYEVFSGGSQSKICAARPCRSSRRGPAAVLLVAGVELHPHGWVCSIS
jgi:hypothetical protein